jgi:hypothetical protein
VAAEITFLMGQDNPAVGNPFYSLAKKYFQHPDGSGTVIDAPAAGQTLEGVFDSLRSLTSIQTTINLVAHAWEFGGMHGAVTRADQASGRRSMTADDLQDVLAKKSLAPPGPAVISSKTRVVIYGCDIGRTSRFLTMLSGLFGNPGEVLAPRRMAIFIPDGTKVKYRLAQTWTLTRKAPLLAGTTGAPTEGWSAFRTRFVADASMKFGHAVVNTGDPLANDHLDAMLTAAAKDATASFGSGSTFFLEEDIDIHPAAGQTPEQAAQSIAPATNGDPVTSLPSNVNEIDDTAVVTTVGPADTYPATPAKTAFLITAVILGKIIDRDVVIAQGTDYQSCCAGKALAPSTGPKAASADAGDGSDGGDPLQSATQLLLAGGVSQSDIDDLLATAPTGDATEDIDTDAPDVVAVDGDTGSGSPPLLETA